MGGAIHSEFGAAARAILVNCLLADNFTTFQDLADHGGAIDHGGGTQATPMLLINCTIANNTTTNGGALYVHLGAHVIIVNSVLWNNAADEIFIGVGGGTADVTYSDIQGGWGIPADMNIDDDPLFVDAANGDYRVMLGSPCFDKGDPIVPTELVDTYDVDQDNNTTEPTPDLDLLDRIVNGLVDMGAYEINCPWDLNGDCVVNTSDLLILFSQWGPPPPPNKPDDFDGDGIVNTVDLLILFANWGPCPCAAEGIIVLTLEEELADACLTMDHWNEYVGVMMGSANQATKDRYQCWMEHYLNDCNRCTCLGPVPCPTPDPFDD